MATSNHNIYYIFGAGASAGKQLEYRLSNEVGNLRHIKFNSLPLANKFTETIIDLKKWMEWFSDSNNYKYPSLNNRLNDFSNKYISEIITAFTKIQNRFNTIDEAAKFYYIKGRIKEFNELKIMISKLFNLIDFLLMQRDPRYMQLLITVLNNKNSIPDNVHFLSWNYDNQFEIAHGILSESVESNNIIKLNGSSPFYSQFYKGYLKLWDGNFIGFTNETIDFFEKEYLSFKNYGNTIRFSWEHNSEEYNDKIINDIKAMKTANNVVVYIGYSLPFVNFPLDSKVLKAINPIKVYMQDPKLNEDYKNVFSERFGYNKKVEIINDCERFFIPNELFVPKDYGNYTFVIDSI